MKNGNPSVPEKYEVCPKCGKGDLSKLTYMGPPHVRIPEKNEWIKANCIKCGFIKAYATKDSE